jgi:hypothetical protein
MTDAERVILLRAALRPFADEGREWLGVHPAHDDLTLLCAEDWHLIDSKRREAAFTVGDFKRAVAAFDAVEPQP